ncbi:MAG: hypothetical protein GY790_06815 [Bacteroidetes bacterium]|nr:hypothetical protein [Bacteroidota bacterium]
MKKLFSKLVFTLIISVMLTAEVCAYTYPTSLISNLGNFVGSSGSLYTGALSGTFSVAGVGYEASYFNTFTGGGSVIFNSSMTPDGTWSTHFDWSTAGFSSDQGAGKADHYQVYKLTETWSPAGTGLSFDQGTFIIGYGDGLGDGDYDDLIIAANPVPVPAAVWLFGSGLLGLIGYSRRKTA